MSDQKYYEDLLLHFMYTNEEVRDKVLPHLNIELFERDHNRSIVEHIEKFIGRRKLFVTI